MLDATLKTQLQAYLTKVTRPVEIVASLDDGENSRQMRELLQEIASLSAQVTLVERDDGAERKPSFRITRPGENIGIRFAAIPLGHEFTSLVLALLQVGGHPPKVSDEVLEQIRKLEGDFNFVTYISLSCQNCPEVVQSLNLMALINPKIRHETVDGSLFQDEVTRLQIMAVPTVMLNGQEFGQGRMELEQILAKVDVGAESRAAAKIAAKEAFDVLVVGGGPAGAAAAVYAARKGIRTGVVTERFGGQVLDTLAIENFISVKETEGPRLAAALEEHVKQYDVDIINLQRAEALVPGDLIEIKLASGASLKSKTVILS
ncbi:FAD-dependent oxidoreductase, partial [Accumulibacter sp.]